MGINYFTTNDRCQSASHEAWSQFKAGSLYLVGSTDLASRRIDIAMLPVLSHQAGQASGEDLPSAAGGGVNTGHGVPRSGAAD